jgi:hypothetical protein
MSRTAALVSDARLEPGRNYDGRVCIEVDEDADACGVDHIPSAIEELLVVLYRGNTNCCRSRVECGSLSSPPTDV